MKFDQERIEQIRKNLGHETFEMILQVINVRETTNKTSLSQFLRIVLLFMFLFFFFFLL